MTKWKPNYLLDEQMYFGDSSVTLLFQIREELRELNKNIKSLNKSEGKKQLDKGE